VPRLGLLWSVYVLVAGVVKAGVGGGVDGSEASTGEIHAVPAGAATATSGPKLL